MRQTKIVDGVETFYAGMAEIRDLGGAGEQIILQPHADFRITDAGGAGEAVSYLHRDHLSSVRLITDAAGQKEQSTSYTPYGDPTTANLQASIPEEHSFIGERFDASTGLLYLNARYYDPALGRFMQPDWWEVRKKGVGTNRYAYSLNDPVNLGDPNGHCPWCLGALIGGGIGFFGSVLLPDLYNGRPVDWGKAIQGTIVGAISGAVGGFVGGPIGKIVGKMDNSAAIGGLVGGAAGGATGGAVGSVADQLIENGGNVLELSVPQIVEDAQFGAIGGSILGSASVGSKVSGAIGSVGRRASDFISEIIDSMLGKLYDDKREEILSDEEEFNGS